MDGVTVMGECMKVKRWCVKMKRLFTSSLQKNFIKVSCVYISITLQVISKRHNHTLTNTIFWGEPAKRVFIFLINPPLLPEHPPSYSPIFMKPPRYLHFNFADLATNLSIAPRQKPKKKNSTIIQLILQLYN